MSSDVNKFHFRLVLMGANGAGKTAILNRFLFKKFEPKYKPTVEDLFSKEFDLGSIELKIDFLDTSGSMQFPAMRRLSITTGDAFLLVYALDDPNSYEVLKLCMAEIQEIRPDFQEIPIVFAGNKSDLSRDLRKVPKEMVSNYVYYELPRLRAKVIECSSKDNLNIDNIFRAYLSLARVSLSATVIIQNSQTAGRHQHHSSLTSKRRPNSALAGDCSVPSGAGRAAQQQAVGGEQETGGGGGGGAGEPSSPLGCAGSIRQALGVRKSCDGSLVNSMRKLSLVSAGGSRSSCDQLLESMCECDTQHAHQPPAPATEQPTSDSVQQLQQHQRQAKLRHLEAQESSQKSSIESLLNEAKQQQQLGAKQSARRQQLAAENGAPKPRSRSLIWRPSRKSARAAQNEASECRVT